MLDSRKNGNIGGKNEKNEGRRGMGKMSKSSKRRTLDSRGKKKAQAAEGRTQTPERGKAAENVC